MNRKFGVPISALLGDAVETTVKFEFQPPRDLVQIEKAYLTIISDNFGVLRYSFESLWGFIGERFDSYKLKLTHKDLIIKNKDEQLDLTNLFKEMNLQETPFIRCRFTRHGQNAYDTLNSIPEVGWFVLEYNSQFIEEDEND